MGNSQGRKDGRGARPVWLFDALTGIIVGRATLNTLVKDVRRISPAAIAVGVGLDVLDLRDYDPERLHDRDVTAVSLLTDDYPVVFTVEDAPDETFVVYVPAIYGTILCGVALKEAADMVLNVAGYKAWRQGLQGLQATNGSRVDPWSFAAMAPPGYAYIINLKRDARGRRKGSARPGTHFLGRLGSFPTKRIMMPGDPQGAAAIAAELRRAAAARGLGTQAQDEIVTAALNINKLGPTGLERAVAQIDRYFAGVGPLSSTVPDFAQPDGFGEGMLDVFESVTHNRLF